MKYQLLFAVAFLSLQSISQNVASLPDGRKVILESNGTWHYQNPTLKESVNVECESSIENLKKPNKNIDRLKSHVAVENDCNVENIKVISFSQGRGNGMYTICVNGKIMKYKMIGTVFMKSEQDPFQSKN